MCVCSLFKDTSGDLFFRFHEDAAILQIPLKVPNNTFSLESILFCCCVYKLLKWLICLMCWKHPPPPHPPKSSANAARVSLTQQSSFSSQNFAQHEGKRHDGVNGASPAPANITTACICQQLLAVIWHCCWETDLLWKACSCAVCALIRCTHYDHNPWYLFLCRSLPRWEQVNMVVWEQKIKPLKVTGTLQILN